MGRGVGVKSAGEAKRGREGKMERKGTITPPRWKRTRDRSFLIKGPNALSIPTASSLHHLFHLPASNPQPGAIKVEQVLPVPKTITPR